MGKTLDDFKNEVAIEHNYTRWQSVVVIGSGFTVEKLNEIALDRYIDSVKAVAFEAGCKEQRKMDAAFAALKEMGIGDNFKTVLDNFVEYDFFGETIKYQVDLDSILSTPLASNPYIKEQSIKIN